MSAIVVDHNLCIHDGICVSVCPSSVLGRDAAGFPVVAALKVCTHCGLCVDFCPTSAIALTGAMEVPPSPMDTERPTPAMVDGLLMGHRSIRHYKDKPVERELLSKLLEVASRAPIGVDTHNLHWIVVNGKEKVHAVAQETLVGLPEELRSKRVLELFASGHDFILCNAPTLVVVCAPREFGDSSWGSNVATAYLQLAADARGVGSCRADILVRAAENHQPLNEMLGVPGGYGIFAALSMGWSQFDYKRMPARKTASLTWI